MRRVLLSVLAPSFFLVFVAALAHETQIVGEGDGSYKVVAGYATEPAYTEERNGLDLFVRTMSDEPVENLQNSLAAELIAPTGETLPLELRGVHGRPGDYTDDFLLTEPGIYRLRVSGFIGSDEVDLTFELHDVAPLDELRFP